jgi:hypothetical protein
LDSYAGDARGVGSPGSEFRADGANLRWGHGWLWFVAWALAGGLLVFSVISIIGVGLFTLPFAVAAIWFVLRRSRRWPEALGTVSGAGLVLLLLAWANRGYQTACYPGIHMGTGGYADCGGVPPVPVAVSGLVLVLIGVGAYAMLGVAVRQPKQS